LGHGFELLVAVCLHTIERSFYSQYRSTMFLVTERKFYTMQALSYLY